MVYVGFGSARLGSPAGGSRASPAESIVTKQPARRPAMVESFIGANQSTRDLLRFAKAVPAYGLQPHNTARGICLGTRLLGTEEQVLSPPLYTVPQITTWVFTYPGSRRLPTSITGA